MVDTVLYLEGERYFSYRILRGVKNRFGSTNEIGMFEMQDKGLIEVSNPSTVLLSERNEKTAGSIVTASIEGTRPILVELQALTSTSVFGIPRRTANGIDYNRLTLLIAVLAIGEVGLTGEVRAINMIEKRIKEVEKMGFQKIIVPESNKKLLKDKFNLDIIGVNNITEAIKYLKLK